MRDGRGHAFEVGSLFLELVRVLGEFDHVLQDDDAPADRNFQWLRCPEPRKKQPVTR
jgi:hypothetical protein